METDAARHLIARRAAQDVEDGMVVNLGIGIPTLVADFVPRDREVIYHSENGLIGLGPAPAKGQEDPDVGVLVGALLGHVEELVGAQAHLRPHVDAARPTELVAELLLGEHGDRVAHHQHPRAVVGEQGAAGQHQREGEADRSSSHRAGKP